VAAPATPAPGAKSATKPAETKRRDPAATKAATRAADTKHRDPAATPEPPRRRRPPRESGERGLRDLVGAGSSQLGVSGALRGRDVNRPTDEDIAEAQRDVVIIRRNWKPDDSH
jgi:hypothetical protein